MSSKLFDVNQMGEIHYVNELPPESIAREQMKKKLVGAMNYRMEVDVMDPRFELVGWGIRVHDQSDARDLVQSYGGMIRGEVFVMRAYMQTLNLDREARLYPLYSMVSISKKATVANGKTGHVLERFLEQEHGVGIDPALMEKMERNLQGSGETVASLTVKALMLVKEERDAKEAAQKKLDDDNCPANCC